MYSQSAWLAARDRSHFSSLFDSEPVTRLPICAQRIVQVYAKNTLHDSEAHGVETSPSVRDNGSEIPTRPTSSQIPDYPRGTDKLGSL